MRIGIFNDEDQIASLAADRILEVYRAKPNFVLGLATGSSPLKLYAELVRRYQAGQISFAQVRSYNLDEYVACPRPLRGLRELHPPQPRRPRRHARGSGPRSRRLVR